MVKPYLAYGHDYHPDLPTDGNFLNNGLVDPYRNPHPHLSEVKKVYEPVQFNYLGNGIIEIENKNFFTDLSDKVIQFKLLIDGKAEIIKDNLEISIAPRSKLRMQVPEIPDIQNSKSEYILEARLIQKEATNLLPKGHEIAWDQFILKSSNSNAISSSEAPIIDIISLGETIQLQNNVVDLRINSKTGEITSWKHQEKEVTSQPIRPNFWRPPTDNDLGNGMDKWAKMWQDATYNYQATLIESPKTVFQGVVFKIEYQIPENSVKVIVNYRLLFNGQLVVNYNFEPIKTNLPNIPRLGMYMTLTNAFSDVLWYGKGPDESYSDRKTGQKLGVYSGKAIDQFHRYSRPQETGNKTDIRWMEVSSKELTLKVSSDQLLNTSVWPFAMQELDFDSDDGAESASGLVPVTKKHGADIKLGETIQWNIDHLQMGLGGDTSWGRLVHPEYTIPAHKNYKYSFTITPKIN